LEAFVLTQLCKVQFTFILLQEGLGIMTQIWGYLTRQFTFGRITVSVSSLIIGLTVLVLTIFLARSGSALLERRLANKRHVDPGLRYTIGRLVKYLILTVGFLLALKQAFAIDLTSIAVLFTALSVGIGFGLQYLAADIASGFILLFERPIRVGDRVTIGEDEGDVQNISLRTTTVVTNNRIAIIVPNSKLVSQSVVNWSYGDPRARIVVPISVADDSDVDVVTKTLLKAVEGVDLALSDPEPRVQFLRFGTTSLDFRLLVWTRDPRRLMQIRSDINYRISRLFREVGIKMPSSKQEVFVHGLDSLPYQEREVLSEDGPRGRQQKDSER
jgi:small-conductance mechanosensitive channel